jgi:hypothetical protein
MMNKSKLILITALAAVTLASPAFAQSFDPDAGTGNVLPFRYETTAPRHDQIAGRQSGLQSYAMVPRSRTFYDYSGAQSGNSYNPATSGYDGGIETQR